MLRDITLGQYYPVESPIHRLDPRTKLFGTMVFILSLFVANNIWGYLLGTIALAAAAILFKVCSLSPADTALVRDGIREEERALETATGILNNS